MENNENTPNTDNEVKETMEQRAEKLAAELGIDKATWPEELRNLDATMLRMENEMGESLVMPAIGQLRQRFMSHEAMNKFHFKEYYIDRNLLYVNRLVEEVAIFMAEERRDEMRHALDDMFKANVDAVLNDPDMLSMPQRMEYQSSNGSSIFPDTLLDPILITQAVNIMAMILSPTAMCSSNEYLMQHQDAIVDLLRCHASGLGLGKAVC